MEGGAGAFDQRRLAFCGPGFWGMRRADGGFVGITSDPAIRRFEATRLAASAENL